MSLPQKRTHVILPEDLLAEVDELVGHRGRSAFLTEILSREVQRRKLLVALQEARGSWKTEDHPELAHGSETFLEQLRSENEERLRQLPEADGDSSA
jgi:metal-responsive CopG/Arc/MetJ family transcriptional regulator